MTNRLPPVARYALAAVAFLIPASWLLMLLACVKYGDTWPATCQPVNYPAAALALAGLVLGAMGAAYLHRAWRRSRKGMWRRAGLGEWRTLENVTEAVWKTGRALAWGSEEEPGELITGEARFTRRRWAIRVQNGQRVYVDRRTFWLWLERVEATAASLPAGQSPVSRRLWEGEVVNGQRLREGDLLAFCYILECVGRFVYLTDDSRSRYYVSKPGAVWGCCEEFEKVMESEEY